MSDGWLAALGTLLAVVIGALSGAIIRLLKARHDAMASDEERAIIHWRGVVDDMRERHREDLRELRAQLQRHDEQLNEDQRLIDALYEDNGDCHANQQLQYAWMQRNDEWCRSASEALKELGKEFGDPPKLPGKPRPRLSRDRAEFLTRTARQNAALVREGDSKVIPPRSAPAGGDP